jgi:pentatricopeptide repeat protein
MLRRSPLGLKKGFTIHPAIGPGSRRGAKNTAWKPKIDPKSLDQFTWALQLEFPARRPSSWNVRETQRLGMQAWPKQVGFYNAGDNFELTPEMLYRLHQRYGDDQYWTQDHSEKVIVAQFPLVEAEPSKGMERVNAVFQSHVRRFGADHIVYNAVMQAKAFAKDYDGARSLFEEMDRLGLEPNAQSYVNMMLAAKLAGKPAQVAEEHFQRAINAKALTAVMRLDTEFQMWWAQLEKMGSFTAKEGYLSNKVEGAAPLPRDPFAIWGWDRDERKFSTPRAAVKAEVHRQTRSGGMTGTVHSAVAREPWFKYRGMRPFDIHGPEQPRGWRDVNHGAPTKRFNPYAMATKNVSQE